MHIISILIQGQLLIRMLSLDKGLVPYCTTVCIVLEMRMYYRNAVILQQFTTVLITMMLESVANH